ncbi:MAG: SlyX protein, partial [Bermanella sp.]
PNRPDIDEQMQDLQTRYAFQEDLINSLNQIVIDQGRHIERVELMIRQLTNSMQELSADVEQFSPDEQRPPHY